MELGEASGAALAAMAVFGLTGSLHCLGMCGPLAAASCRWGPEARGICGRSLMVYALVRIASYGVIGFAAGLLGAVVIREWLAVQAQTLAVIFATLMLIWAGLDLFQGVLALRRGEAPKSLAAGIRGQGSSLAWIAARILALPLPSGVALGVATAVLPCGFLAAAWLQAAVLSHPPTSALAMVVFGVVTSPALLSGALVTLGLQRKLPRFAPLVGSVLLLLASLLLLARVAPPSTTGHDHHQHHEHHD